MNLPYLLEHFESLTIKDLSENYESLKKDMALLSDKVKHVAETYINKNIEIEQIPDLMKDITEIISLLK